jgi:hypothetical protein
VRQLRSHLASGAAQAYPPNVPVTTWTGLGSWIGVSGSLLWIASRTGWMMAWLAFALTSLMPALMLMVIAQTAERPTARLMHDQEPDRFIDY